MNYIKKKKSKNKHLNQHVEEEQLQLLKLKELKQESSLPKYKVVKEDK